MTQQLPGTHYGQLLEELQWLWGEERSPLPRMANMVALLYRRLPEVNWVGVYLREGQELVLGPFQGAPACQRILLGKGVCGTAAVRRQSIVVPDVSRFPGYIACSPETQAELVVPLCWGAELYGVLDLDSPVWGASPKRMRAGWSELLWHCCRRPT
jgi:L-methionine (R)-S-oxide reductase